MSDLRDSIEQAISDSLDADWQPEWAAEAIMELPEIKALLALRGQVRNAVISLETGESKWAVAKALNAALGAQVAA